MIKNAKNRLMKKLHKSIIFLLCLICFSGAISVPQTVNASECDNRAITLKYNDLEFYFDEACFQM